MKCSMAKICNDWTYICAKIRERIFVLICRERERGGRRRRRKRKRRKRE
jgi:hypothetical protein